MDGSGVSSEPVPTVAAPAPSDGVLRLTLLLLLVFGGSGWDLNVPLKVMCGAALVLPRLARSAIWWTALTALLILVNGTSWQSIDNHKYLISYWSLCVTMAVAWPVRAGRILSWNAHGLVGACFAFAVIWNVWAGEYFDGSFLHLTFLTDPRVASAASAAGGIPLADLSMNTRLAGMVGTWPSEAPVVQLASSHRLALIALGASYWTLFIESLISVSWLVPAWSKYLVKDAALMAFILTTYALLPVVGFATVLGVLGYTAAVGDGRSKLAGVYLAVIGLAQLASVPWDDYLSRLLVR